MQVRYGNQRSGCSGVGVAIMALAIGSGGLFVSGCATPLRKQRPVIAPDELSDAVFVHYLAATSVVTFDEAARGVLLVVADADASTDAATRHEALARRGMIHETWALQSDSVLDRGTFAYLLCRGLEVPRGFNEWLAGWTGIGKRRAALATAVYEGLLAYGPAHEPISGGEVADSLVRAEHWLDRRRGTGEPHEP